MYKLYTCAKILIAHIYTRKFRIIVLLKRNRSKKRLEKDNITRRVFFLYTCIQRMTYCNNRTTPGRPDFMYKLLRTFYNCYTYQLRLQHFECNGCTFKYAGGTDLHAQNNYSSVIRPFLTPVSTCPNRQLTSIISFGKISFTRKSPISFGFRENCRANNSILAKTAKSFN